MRKHALLILTIAMVACAVVILAFALSRTRPETTAQSKRNAASNDPAADSEEEWTKINQLSVNALSLYLKQFPNGVYSDEARKLIADNKLLADPKTLLASGYIISSELLGWSEWLAAQQDKAGVVLIAPAIPGYVSPVKIECWEGSLSSSVQIEADGSSGIGRESMPAGNGTILVVRDQVQFQRLLIQGRKENPLHLGILREHGLVYLSGEGVVQQLDKGTTTVLRSARPATSDRLRSFCRWFLSERRGGIVAVDNPVFDFGVVDQNTEVKHTFVVKNAGEDTLALTGMKSSCGCNPYEISARVEEIAQTGRMCNCIEAKASKMRIAPGESSEIESSCWLALSPGNQESVVTIQTNDRENPLLKLRMVGKVRARVVFSPEYLMFDKAVVGQEFRKALSIRNPGPEPMEISGLKVVPANALSVAVGSDTTPAFPIRLDEGQEMPLTVKLLIPSDWPTKKQVTEVWEQGQGKRSVVLPSFFGVFQIVTAGADPEPKNLRLIIQARME